MKNRRDGRPRPSVGGDSRNNAGRQSRRPIHRDYGGCPDVIVKSLAHENIEKAIAAYSECNAFWLKCYYMFGVVDVEVLNKVVDRHFGSQGNKEDATIRRTDYRFELSSIDDTEKERIEVHVTYKDGNEEYVFDVATPE